MSRTGKPDAKGRSKGERRYVGLPHSLLNTDAYASLSCTARALLVEVIKRYNGSNNGEITLSIRDATAALGLSDHKATKSAFDQLVDRRFIVMERDSSFSQKLRLARVWRLTHLPTKSRSPTQEYERWRHPIEEKLQRRKSRAMVEKTTARDEKLVHRYGRSGVDNSTAETINSSQIGVSLMEDSSAHLFSQASGTSSEEIADTFPDIDADDVRRAAKAWVQRKGYGSQGKLARAARLTDVQMSRFLLRGGRVSADSLERLAGVVGSDLPRDASAAPRQRSGRA